MNLRSNTGPGLFAGSGDASLQSESHSSPFLDEDHLMLKGRGEFVDWESGAHDWESGVNDDSKDHMSASPQQDITTGYYPQDSSSIEFDREYRRRQNNIGSIGTDQEMEEPQTESKKNSSSSSYNRIGTPKVKEEGTLSRSFYRSSGGSGGAGGRQTSPPTEAMEFRLSLIDLRSREDFRVNYLKKLSYAYVLDISHFLFTDAQIIDISNIWQ